MKKKKMTDEEMPASMMFLEMLIEAGHTPKAVVIANTKKEKLNKLEGTSKANLKKISLGD